MRRGLGVGVGIERKALAPDRETEGMGIEPIPDVIGLRTAESAPIMQASVASTCAS